MRETPPTGPIWFHHLMALVTCLTWSFSFLFIVKLNRAMTPIGVVALRFDIFAIFVIALLAWRRPSVRGLTRKQWAIIIAMSLVAGPMYHSVFSWAAGRNIAGESRIDPGLLGLILATVPVHTGWLGWLFLRERLTLRKIAALTLGLGGVAAVIFGRYGGIELLPENHLEGPVGATIAAVFAGGIAVLTRAGGRIYAPADLVAVTGALMVLYVLILHPFAQLQDIPQLDAAAWGAALFLGIFGLGTAHITWAAALRGLQAVSAAMYLFLASVLAALWGFLFDGKPIGLPWVAGASLVLCGLLVMAWPRRTAMEGTE